MSDNHSTAMSLADCISDQLRRSWRSGDCVSVEILLGQHSNLMDDPSAALQVIYTEVLLRQEFGTTPSLVEYEQRFPQFAEKLKLLFDVHRVIESGSIGEFAQSAAKVASGEAPTVAPFSAEPSVDESAGARIGPYKLLQKIGEGGFGVVWMAEQEKPIRRQVAVKIIKPGMHSRQVVARFEAERQALALMDHPNIARVLDGGATESGQPYFVMELVKGVPITTYCDEHRLTPRQRLELFIRVCQAVQHAHQKGIIHRDPKPSNVIVIKTLDKDRSRRYETANGLALDIERYLKDEPVQASPPSAWYRCRKSVWRNKLAITVAGLFAMLLLAGVAGLLTSTLLISQSYAAERKARAQAEVGFKRARSAIDEIFTQVSQGLLVNVYESDDL